MGTPGPLACTLAIHSWVATWDACVHNIWLGTPHKPGHILCPTLGQPRPMEKSGRTSAHESGMGASHRP